MYKTFKWLFRGLVVVALLWTGLAYQAERQAQSQYLLLHQQCMDAYAALPDSGEGNAAWDRQCSRTVNGAPMTEALKSLDRTQRSFFTAVIGCLVLFLAVVVIYLFRRKKSPATG